MCRGKKKVRGWGADGRRNRIDFTLTLALQTAQLTEEGHDNWLLNVYTKPSVVIERLAVLLVDRRVVGFDLQHKHATFLTEIDRTSVLPRGWWNMDLCVCCVTLWRIFSIELHLMAMQVLMHQGKISWFTTEVHAWGFTMTREKVQTAPLGVLVWKAHV